MKKIIATILGVILIGTLATGCGGGEEVQLNNAGEPYVAKTATDSYSENIKYSCRHFKSLLSNADVTTYAEQLKEFKTVYTAASVAYENGEWQSGSIYYAARIAYSAAIDDFFNAEAIGAMAELTVLCSSVPNW
jgi:hypothetical protein